MKARGMIFNSEMVRAILDGRKTQTRRIMKIQPEHSGLGLRRVIDSKNGSDDGKYFWSSSDSCGLKARSKSFACPFGAVGDRIWVRETWALLGNEDGCCVDWNDNLCKGDEKTAARIYVLVVNSAPEIMGCGLYPTMPTGSRTLKMKNLKARGDHPSTCRDGPAAFCWKLQTCGLSG